MRWFSNPKNDGMLNTDNIQIVRRYEIHTRKIPHEIEIIVEGYLNVIDHVIVK